MSDGVRIRAWRAGRPIDPSPDLEKALTTPGTLVWVDAVGASPAALSDVARRMGVNPRAVETALALGARPKTSRYRGTTFVTVHASELTTPKETRGHESRLLLHRVSVFVLAQGLLTIRPDEAFGGMDEVLREAAAHPDLIEGGPLGLLRALLNVVVDGHFNTIQAIDDVAEEVEDLLFADRLPPGRVMQESLYRVHKELVQLRRAVLPMREVVATLMRVIGDQGHLAADYRDLYDHVIRATEWTESLRDMVSALFETNVSLLDARLNVVMKKLAGWAAVIAVPTAITGWFGQNVPFPGFSQPFGLWLSLVLIVAGTGGVYATLRRHNWI